MQVKKREGHLEELDIKKIQKMTIPSCQGLVGTNSSELEVDAHIKFIDGMDSADIQDALIKTAVDKTDIDRPNWTFVGARLFIYDLYHRVGKATHGIKGKAYCHFKDYLDKGKSEGRLLPQLGNGFDLEDLNNYIKPERDFLFNYLGIKTLYDRYLIKDKKGQPIELPQQMFMAIAIFLAQKEKNKQTKAKEFYDVISNFEVMLATPTLSNARTNRHQLSSCYIGSTPDNIEGIFDMFKEFGILSKFGGGVGQDWNQIRSLGGVIDNNINAAGGVVPQMKIVNDIAIAYDQLGTRKGAIATYLEPWHQDIVDFIDLKKNSGEERRRAHDIFPALWITDLFMERVISDSTWTLFDPYDVPELKETHGETFKKYYVQYENDSSINKTTIRAKDLWRQVLTSYFESGSPFLCFKDTANRANPNPHVGHIRSSNLCTEIFQNTEPDKYLIKIHIREGNDFILAEESEIIYLSNNTTKLAKNVTSLDTLASKHYMSFIGGLTLESDYDCEVYCVEKHKIDGKTAVCNLASVNLSKINTKKDIERVVPIAVNMLDNVIDLNFYPLLKVKKTNMASRSIGLGVMGEAEMLAVNKIHFGSQEHLDKIDYIMECVSYNTIKASSDLGKEKGNYPDFNGSNWSKGIMPQDFTNELVRDLTTHKNIISCYSDEEWLTLRNSCKKFMRNGYLMAIAPTSSISILVGTTQAIEPIYKKKWYEENLSGLIPIVVPKLNPDTWNYYVSAFDIDQTSVIRAASVRQKWIDQGQSTNIFILPENTTGKTLNNIYTLAWKLGLKSTYYLRSQSAEAKKDTEVDVVDRTIECSGCQ